MNEKLKNRLTSLLVIVSILLSFGNFVIAEEKITKEDMAVDFFSHLASIRDVEFIPDNVVTRGEYAAILANICRLNYDDEITEDELED